MKRYFPETLSLRDTAFLIIGAALYAAAMPGKNTSLGFLAYFALIPLFFCLKEKNNSRKVAFFGLFFGSVASFLLLGWIRFTVSVYGNLGDFVGILSAALLSIYCGIFTSVFSLIMAESVNRFGFSALFGAPFIWAGIDILRIRSQIGFPWLLLGYSQYGDFFARQFAAYGGVVGTGFLLILINLLFFFSIRGFKERRRRKAVIFLSAAFSVVFLLHLPGFLRGAVPQAEGEDAGVIVVTAVQPNIDQWKKWDVQFREETLGIMKQLTEDHVKNNVDLIIWPETALPFFYYWDKDPTVEIKNFIKKLGKPVVTGIPWYDGGGKGRYFNSIGLLAPSGDIYQRYDKMKLVPFGEYVPLRKVLFFIDKITEGAEDFSRGNGMKLLTWNAAKVIPAVCYEAIFPHLSVQGVFLGGNLLVNVTNDAWFGDTQAPYQHLYMAAYRTVETGRYMVRVANSGITAVIDQFGNVKTRIELFERGGITARVSSLSGMTFYVKNAKFIDSFIISGSIILIGGIIIGRFKKWQEYSRRG
jgi:apolipoprotein N-acyltransferase